MADAPVATGQEKGFFEWVHDGIADALPGWDSVTSAFSQASDGAGNLTPVAPSVPEPVKKEVEALDWSSEANAKRLVESPQPEELSWIGRQFYEVMNSPDDTLNTLAKQPGMAGIADIMRQDEALKNAFHNAIVNDGTFKPGLEALQNAGDGSFNVEDIEEMLKDPTRRKIFTDVLNKVAEDPNFNFSHVSELLDLQKNGDQLGSMKLLKEMGVELPASMGAKEGMAMFFLLMKNPQEGASQIMEMMKLSGQLEGMDPEMMKVMEGGLALMGNILQLQLGPFADILQKHGYAGPGISMEQGFEKAKQDMKDGLASWAKDDERPSGYRSPMNDMYDPSGAAVERAGKNLEDLKEEGLKDKANEATAGKAAAEVTVEVGEVTIESVEPVDTRSGMNVLSP